MHYVISQYDHAKIFFQSRRSHLRRQSSSAIAACLVAMASFLRRTAVFLLALYAMGPTADVGASTLPSHARNGRLWAMIQAETQGLFSTSSPEFWFKQRVDHFSESDTSTFQQRFYEVNTHWKSPDGPVILSIGGEGALDRPPTGGFIDTLAQRWGAKVLALEHRFYGKSIPNNDLSTENYKYLTVQQALADLKYFKEQYELHNLLGGRTAPPKWVAIGGSYPGALSAWFRVAYPNTTVAALSSSGVVLPIYDFHGFDEQVAESAGPKCADALRQTTRAFEDEIQRGNATRVKSLLGAQALADADFFYMLADAAAMAVQYGHKDVVCKAMTDAVDQKLLLPEAFAKFTIDMYGDAFGSGCFYDTTCLAHDKSRWADVRSWRWQKCSQLAYFQTAPATGSLRASIVNLEYHLQQCRAVFGDVVNPAKGVEEIIQLYGGASPKAHNIFFANGGDDPWQRASVLETLSDDEIAFLAKCDLCGHCGDLSAPRPNAPAPLKQQQQEIIKYLTKWLNGDNARADAAVQVFTTDAAIQDMIVSGEQKKEVQAVDRSSPLVLVPVLLALLVLFAVIKSDLVRDRPRARRAGYVRLEAD
jgi:hypothetical protein